MKIGPLIIAGLVGIVILVGVAALLLYRANLNKTKSKRPAPPVDPLTPGVTGKVKTNWTPWASSALVIASFALLFILIAIFFPALWEWFYSQGKVFGLLVITILVVALATKYKPVWWLAVIMGAVLLFSWTSFPPNPLDWRQPTLAKANQATGKRQITPEYGASRATAGRSTMTSRVTSRTIVAKPGVYSDRVSVPFGQTFNTRPQGKIRTLTASGKTWDDWPGRPGVMRYNVSPEDAMFQFMSLEEKEVEVIVEWEPR